MVLLRSQIDLVERLPGCFVEWEPAIERGGPPFASAARLDANGVGQALDDIAEARVLVGDETRNAHPVRRVFVPRISGMRLHPCHRSLPQRLIRAPRIEQWRDDCGASPMRVHD